ncbi:Uma2 family endonuclease [Streptomyces cupreus]|uniref:Uma2 family endonuclease n=1 Tax=Streptomyces cupreus TaxID=2759956 RepID=A0A7X1JA28_9ACTN|nr:Uma2 family endonuclease [Streptomyces cupreus]MBC2906948.1 Uma2 family endonuclease [Streptomyces cupreus]
MGAMALDPITQKVLLDWIVDLDTPEGLRVELIEGEVVVTRVPDGHHEHCISEVVSQVHQRSSTDMQFSGNKGLKLRSADGCPQDHVIPNGTFAPKELRLHRGADPWMPCEGVTMALEVMSGRPRTAREIKRRCYARGGVPHCLLIDRETGWITLFGAPESDDYQELHAVAFGKPLPLPAPFAFDLETTDLL